MKKFIKNLSVEKTAIIFWLLYSLVICAYFFRPWYVRSLDYFFPPFGWIIAPWSNGFLISILATFCKHIIATQVLEKIILLCAFFVPFIWWVLLVKRSKSLWAMCFAGICMTCNPYFYDRFVDGQLGMYLLFCVIPFWLLSLYNFFCTDKNKVYSYIILVFLSLITTSISMHGGWFLLISGIVFFVVFCKDKNIGNYLWQSGLLAVCILIANLYRIIPNMTNINGAQQRIQNFSSTDLAIFENYTWHANNYITTLSLQWYWWEWYDRFMSSYWPQKFPFIIFSFLFVLVLLWIYHTLADTDTNQKKFGISLLMLTIIWYVLGLGIAGDTIFAGLTRFLYTHVPFYQAMRESHKWVLFMVIGYAYFGASGIHFLSTILKEKLYSRMIVSLSGIVILLGYTPAIFLLNTQIPVVDYPDQRYALRSNLLAHTACQKPDCYDSLILPWHQYMYLSFVGKNVLNPSHTFFNPLQVVAWDNIEIWSLYSQSKDPQSIKITGYLSQKNIIHTQTYISGTETNESFIQYLQSIGISHIILLKEVDYKNYQPLMEQLSQEKYIYKSLDNDYFYVYTLY